MARQTLLLNWVYYPPVGHAVEAFKIAKGLHTANQPVDVHVLLNSKTAVELATACDWITRAYPIDLDEIGLSGDSSLCLRSIPKLWDYIVNDHRPTASPFFFAPPLRTFHDLAESHFTARIWRGGHHQLPSNQAPFYQPNATIRLSIPPFANEFVAERFGPLLSASQPNFCLLLGGSNHEPIYPKIEAWIGLIHALQREFPNPRFFVTGKSAKDDRSSTLAYSGPQVTALLSASENIVDCYDIGLWNQLALLASCQMLLSPHSGFAFLAPCVGTPWLTFSGVRWPECFFNDVPFYSVLPACTHYPCWKDMKPECESRLQANETLLCMDELLPSRTADMLSGARLLLDRGFTFGQAMQLYRERIEQMGSAKERFFQIV